MDIHPLTKDRWPDLVELFSRPGGSIVCGCYCMYYRKAGPTPPGAGEANKKAMKSLVSSGYVPGLIAYQDGSPVGWISLSPREDYARLKRSPVMKPVDDKLVWSIVCFFVDRRSRGARSLGKVAHGRHGLRPLTGSPPSGGLSHRQGEPEPSRLHVLRCQVPLRPGRLQGGGAADRHAARGAARAAAAPQEGMISEDQCIPGRGG